MDKNVSLLIGRCLALVLLLMLMMPSLPAADGQGSAEAGYAAGDYVIFGHYPQTADGTDSTPIEWLVLDFDEADNRILLISRYGLDTKLYHPEYIFMTWEECELRGWLNGEFMDCAFSADEQAAILTTDVDNSDDQGYGEWNTSGGNNTQDRIFLLSYAEAKKYFKVSKENYFNVKARTTPTAYALQAGAYTSSDKTADGAAAGAWWLRSPGAHRDSAAEVVTDGSLESTSVITDCVCVRPAMWIDVNQLHEYNP